MAGFNFTPPPGPMPPMQNLQQMALQAFRPPPPMNMGQMGTPGMGAPQQQQGGFGAAQGAGMLSGALGGFKGWGNGPDGLPTSGMGNMTGDAAQNAVNGYGTVQADPTGFTPAYGFLGGAGQFGSNWGGGGG